PARAHKHPERAAQADERDPGKVRNPGLRNNSEKPVFNSAENKICVTRSMFLTIIAYAFRVEFKASFPYSTVSISDFHDLIYRIKKNYLGNDERTEDSFVIKIRGHQIISTSVDDFRSQLSEVTGKNFFKLGLRKLSFTIKSSDWFVSFNGSKNPRILCFVDTSKHQSARGKCNTFKRFWKKQIDLTYENSKSWKILLISTYIDQIDIFLVLVAIFGELINILTWQYLYSGNLPLYFPSLVFLIQIAYSFVPAVLIEFMLIRIEYIVERNEAVERLSRDKFSMWGMLKANISLLLRLTLIPLIVLIYDDSLFLSIFPTLPHTFLHAFLDIAPVSWAVTILILLAVKIISRIIRGEGINRSRPINKREFLGRHRGY
ncbi:MAG: hypothetical protein ACYCT2_03150, partial [Thermoplasmataceae archaeon]